MIINYCKDGIPIADKNVEEYLIKCYNQGEDIIDISTENALYMSRVLIKRGVFDHKNIKYYLEGEDVGITVDKNGSITRFAIGWSDFTDSILEELLGWF